MDAPSPTPAQRWYQSGGFVITLLVAMAIVAMVVIFLGSKFAGENAANTNVSPFTSNPRALASLPTTTVAVATADDPSWGPATAAVTVVEFIDYQCPFCKQAFPTVRQLMTEFGDRVRFQVRDYPVAELHPDAVAASEAAACAWDQGADRFWAFHDRLYLNQSQLDEASLRGHAIAVGLDQTIFNRCFDSGAKRSEVEADYASGIEAGVRGTPTFFVNQRRIEGAVGAQILRDVINAELAAS